MKRHYLRRIILNFMGAYSYRLELISKKKWPNEEVHLINVNPQDDLHHEKFEVLKKADHFTQIYMVGHHYPKELGLFNMDNTHCFNIEWIASLLCMHAQPQLVFNENLVGLHDIGRVLEIQLIACHSGKRLGIISKQPSFAEKLFCELKNHKQHPILAEIHAPKMFVFPVPCAESHYKSSEQARARQASYNQDWHLRYVDVPIWRGQVAFRRGYTFYSFFKPGTKPPGNYKQIIRPSGDTDTGYEIISVKAYELAELNHVSGDSDNDTVRVNTIDVDGSLRKVFYSIV